MLSEAVLRKLHYVLRCYDKHINWRNSEFSISLHTIKNLSNIIRDEIEVIYEMERLEKRVLINGGSEKYYPNMDKENLIKIAKNYVSDISNLNLPIHAHSIYINLLSDSLYIIKPLLFLVENASNDLQTKKK